MSGKAFRTDWACNLRRKMLLARAFHRVLIALAGPALERYIREVCAADGLTGGSPPILRFQRDGVAPRALPVDAEAAWAILARARDLHSQNVRLILAAKNDEASYDGLAPSNSISWRKRETLMYYAIQKIKFTGQKQICTVADPSTHGSEETMVGIVYSWFINLAAVGSPPSTPRHAGPPAGSEVGARFSEPVRPASVSGDVVFACSGDAWRRPWGSSDSKSGIQRKWTTFN